MSGTRKKRVIIALILLIAFAPVYLVKSIHHHESGYIDKKCCSHSDHSQSNHPHSKADDCAICKYTLSLFTETSPVEFHCQFSFVSYEPIIYQDKIVCKQAYSYLLRAPPVA